jgi:hypothetical protein
MLRRTLCRSRGVKIQKRDLKKGSSGVKMCNFVALKSENGKV